MQFENQEEWCLGWKLTGTRALTAAELDELQGEKNRLLRKKWGFSCAAPLMLGVLLFVFTYIRDVSSSNSTAASWLAGAALVSLLVPAWMLLRASDARDQSRGRVEDVQAGMVKRFAGARENFARPDLLGESNHGMDWIEVLPHSQTLYSINGQLATRYESAPIAVVATPPESAAQSSFWHQAGGGDDVTLRALSSAEKDELIQHSRTLWRAQLNGFLLCVILGGLPVLLLPQQASILAPYILCVAVGWPAWKLLQAHFLRRKLARDVEGGQVALLRPPLKGEVPDEAAAELRAALWEVLPESGLIWTADGVPAAWRKTKI